MCFENRIMKKRVLSGLMAVLVCCAALCGCGKEIEEASVTEIPETVQTTAATEDVKLQELVVETVEDQGDTVVVTTSFGQIKYPFAFADLIQVKAVNEETVASLEFAALISGEEYPLYALRFGGSEGIALGTLEIPEEAEPRDVHAEFYSADEAALGDKLNTFRAVQETFNDVVASLNNIPGFAPAE